MAAEPARVRVATFSCDVTPPIGGQSLIWLAPAKTIEDPLFAKGIVLDDGQKRYVLCAIDFCGLCNSSHRLFVRKLAEAVATDVSRVAVHTVHQHTAPYLDGDAQRLLDKTAKSPRYVDFKFLDETSDRVAAAAKQSLTRLELVDRVGLGQAAVERVASSRRIITPDGKFHGRMSSAKDPALRALPEGAIDPLLRTVTLAQGQKPLVRLHYYATHPQSFYGDARASADVPGMARDRLKKQEGVEQIYFDGCGGDVAMGKYNDGSRQARAELAERLFAGMAASAASTRFFPLDRLQWRSTEVVLPLADDVQTRLAAERKTLADVALDDLPRVIAATRVSFLERAREPVALGLLTLGPVRILHLPGEAMLEFQKYAQGLRPGEFVAVAAYGDLSPGYICTEQAFREGGYEPSASHAGPKAEAALKGAIDKLLK
jgi:hypothetical protein